MASLTEPWRVHDLLATLPKLRAQKDALRLLLKVRLVFKAHLLELAVFEIF